MWIYLEDYTIYLKEKLRKLGHIIFDNHEF